MYLLSTYHVPGSVEHRGPGEGRPNLPPIFPSSQSFSSTDFHALICHLLLLLCELRLSVLLQSLD